MKQTIIALAAAGTILAAALPSPAQARCYGCGVAAGAAVGVAAGALIGSAIAGPPAPVYVVPPPPPPSAVYYEGAPVCHVERHRVWVNGFGWRYRHVEVCD
jgi:hypothetical protein